MNYSINFGTLSAASKIRQGVGATFGLAVLGDFSGRANRGELETGASLVSRKPRRVDVDNLDDILESMKLRLSLPIGDDGGAVEVAITSMEDFHPDELYSNVHVFSELSSLRRRLQNQSTFEAAAAEVRSWGDAAPDVQARYRAKPRGTAIPNAKLSDFARLMGTTTALAAQTPADELIKQIVRPYIKRAASPDQGELLAAVDRALAGLMRRLLHHPDFQTLESLWRSVDLLVRELETDANLQIILYDVTAEEIAADLSAGDSLEETGLYQLLVDQPALDLRTAPPSVIVGNYMFQQTPPHADLLGRIAKIAAASQAPFIAAIGNDAFEKKKPEEVHPLVVESWDSLRALPHAAYLGLSVPRFMLRWPYGPKTEPIDAFEFEEFTAHFGLKGFLWGNGAILAGMLLAKTFREQGMGAMELGSIMIQGDLPLYYYTDSDGDQIALPCTERLASEAVAAHVIGQGFMPLLWMRGRPEVRLGSLGSVNGAQLAGPWAPVEMPPDPVKPSAAPASPSAAEPSQRPPEEPDEGEDSPPLPATPQVAQNASSTQETLPAAPPEHEPDEEELDDLLADLESPEPSPEATPEPAKSDATAADDSEDEEGLEALLAGIEGEGQVDDEDSGESGMDADLAALLAEL